MVCFVDEYSGFRTIDFVEKLIDVRKIVKEYIAKAKIQRGDCVKLLKVEIEDEYMKDIHELISPSLQVESTPLVCSSTSPISRVGATEKYHNKLISMVDLM